MSGVSSGTEHLLHWLCQHVSQNAACVWMEVLDAPRVERVLESFRVGSIHRNSIVLTEPRHFLQPVLERCLVVTEHGNLRELSCDERCNLHRDSDTVTVQGSSSVMQ